MQQNLSHIARYIHDLIPYEPGKTVSEIQRTYGLSNVIKLASNENPLGPSPRVIETLQKIDPRVISDYPEDQAPSLHAAIAKINNIQPDQITLGAGSSEIFDLIIQIFLSSGGELLVSEHAWSLYRIFSQALGKKVVIIKDKNYHHDLPSFLKAINDSTRLIIIPSPNNPTGTWISYNELESFITDIPPYITVVIDEAYHEYMTDKRYQTVTGLIKKHPNLIVSRTFSKMYALAGLRIGYSIASAEVAGLINKFRKSFTVSSLALYAAEVALSDHEYIEKTKKINSEGMKQLRQGLQQLGVSIIGDAGNFVCAEFPMKAKRISDELLLAGFIVRPLLPYNMDHHLRISIGTEEQNRALLEKLASLE